MTRGPRFRRVRSLKVLAMSGLALTALVGAEASQAVAEGFFSAQEDEMLGLVNNHRSEHALPALRPDHALQMVARRQASRMVAAGYIYHNPDIARESEEAVPGWLRIGENVGVGPGVGEVHNAFLGSPPHHANVDHNGYSVIAIGAAASGDGALYFTQNYALPPGGAAPASAPGAGPSGGGADAAAAAAGGGTVAAAPECRRRGRRLVCRQARNRARGRARPRRQTRVKGVELIRSAAESGERQGVSLPQALGGMLARAADRATWWD